VLLLYGSAPLGYNHDNSTRQDFQAKAATESDSRMGCMVSMRHLTFALSVTILLLATTGCGIFQSSSGAPLELNYAGTLPASWNPLGTWHPVNVDDDDDVEYLLLFTYDQGQVGGAIYDSQISPDLLGVVDIPATPVPSPTITLVPVPLQPLAYYRPYRLMPSSWSYSYGGNVGHGFLAAPGDSGNVQILAPPRPDGNATATAEISESTVAQSDENETEAGQENAESSSQQNEQSMPNPELEMMILGGDTHLTFVWWRDQLRGYGVTQLTAQAGFSDENWQDWPSNPIPIQEIDGLDPLTDYRARSQLCRITHYTRDKLSLPPDPSMAGLPSISFSEENQGLTFCNDVPAYPFYPEGVVMAYLTLADGAATDAELQTAAGHLLTEGVDADTIQRDTSQILLQDEMVDDIAAYETVPAQPAIVTDDEYLPTTTVCVEAAERDDPQSRRWVVYTLQYQPPDFSQRLPDRWTISSATEIPRPPSAQSGNGQASGYCSSLLNSLPK
jgi:hypothetical protein